MTESVSDEAKQHITTAAIWVNRNRFVYKLGAEALLYVSLALDLSNFYGD